MATSSPSLSSSREERIGLILAVAAHLALAAWFLVGPARQSVLPTPERMTVSLAEDVAPVSAAPDPVPAAAAAVAPQLGEAMPEPAQQQAAIVPPSPPQVAPPVARTAPSAVRQPPAPSAAQRPAAAPAPKPAQKPGGQRLGADFLKGIGSDQSAARGSPASQVGAMSTASLSQAVARQIKPHWVAPQGADAEQLVTVLAFELNRDGSLAGRPRVVSQSGVTPANAPQKDRHAEQAIRAVQLAAPFDLPDQYYDKWKRVSAFRFDRRLSQ